MHIYTQYELRNLDFIKTFNFEMATLHGNEKYIMHFHTTHVLELMEIHFL